jgi:hypothetical protein
VTSTRTYYGVEVPEFDPKRPVPSDRCREVYSAVLFPIHLLLILALTITVPWTRPWQRPGFTRRTIIRGVAAVPLEPPCDRLLALVDRHVGDALWGLPLLPEIGGSVEAASATRGYVVANRATLTQPWASPTEAAVHEFHHMLGCPHAKSRVLCYRRIATLKREADDGLVPAMALDGRLIATRAEANLRVAAKLNGREGPIAASQIPALGESR